MTYLPKRPPLDPCPVEATLAAVGGKWTSRILFFLSRAPRTLPELQDRLPGARHQVLRTRLRHLQAEGLVSRSELEGVHQNVRYALTDAGRALLPVLDGMRAWGEARIGVWVEPE